MFLPNWPLLLSFHSVEHGKKKRLALKNPPTYSSFTRVQSAFRTQGLGVRHGRIVTFRRYFIKAGADEGVQRAAETAVYIENALEDVRIRLGFGCRVALEEWDVNATA